MGNYLTLGYMWLKCTISSKDNFFVHTTLVWSLYS